MRVWWKRPAELLLLALIVMAAAAVGSMSQGQDSTGEAATGLQRIEARHLPNAWRITPKVISGGLPEDDAAFAELAALGVKTVISVDGMTPDVATAKKHGLRYVHLPHGYDQVPVERGHELARAVKDLPGPIYIHCHHGKHRSPSAAVVACIEAGELPAEAGEAILRSAGTNPNYRGLYDSVRKARPLPAGELSRLKVEFREVSPIPPLAAAMVELERAFDRTVKLEKKGVVGRRQGLHAQPAAVGAVSGAAAPRPGEGAAGGLPGSGG